METMMTTAERVALVTEQLRTEMDPFNADIVPMILISETIEHAITNVEEVGKALTSVRKAIDAADITPDKAEVWLVGFMRLARAIDELISPQLAAEASPASGRLHELVKSHWERIGRQNTTMQGIMMYLDRRLTARLDDARTDSALAALEGDADTAYLVRKAVNAQSLAAWARQLPQNDEGMPDIPPELEGLVRVGEVYTIRSRGATKR